MDTQDNANLAQRVQSILDREVRSVGPLSGGCVGEVYLVHLAASEKNDSEKENGEKVVVKADQRAQPQLAVEGFMLTYLRRHSSLPVPRVHHSSDRLLIIEFLPGSSRFSPAAEIHLAELVADLHAVTADGYGLERDTLIGLLPQPNGWWDSWVAFFAEQRLRHLARLGVELGRMPTDLQTRVDRFAADLDRWIDEPPQPGLVHGDLWTANVLAAGDRITGCIDPALYYADPEVDLAYMRLFHSFGEPFFRRYHELRPIRPGFFEERQHIYNLYPLLSHVCHFGGHYVESVSQTLARFGY